uniref:Uncharacterized protein n=1 Tax=viral metagenome TaxID=1070528 RepID=A0A6M3JNV4_9ZZZZ
MLDKFSGWLLGIIGTIIGFLCVDNIRFRRSLPKEYVLKEDFVRITNENRQDHQIMLTKLDAIRDKLDGKADK